MLDVPHFLWRLIQIHPKQFTRTLAKLAYPDSAHWSAVARQIWTDQYPLYRFQKTKCNQLAAAMVLRECWLQKSHGETVRLFYQLGWKPLDVMLAWLIGDYTTFGESIDPACAAEAAREDPETAVWLLDPDHYRAYFTDQFHFSYDSAMAQAWTTFLYCYCGWTDFAPLEKGHRLKRMNAHYQAILERCRTPDWVRLELEKELRKTGLLASETPPDWSSSKLAKAQRLALTRVLVCHYQWRTSDLLAALAAAEQPEVFTSLLWGVYREEQLETAFLLNRDGIASGEDGQPVDLPADAQIGLAATTELDKKQLALWKKRVMVEKKACRKSLCPTGYSRKSTCIITDMPDSLHDSAVLYPNAGHNQIPKLQAWHEQAPALFLGGSVDKALQTQPVGKCDGQIAVAAQPGSGDCDL